MASKKALAWFGIILKQFLTGKTAKKPPKGSAKTSYGTRKRRVDYGQFLTIATFYDNSNYSYRDITGANLAAALQRAVLNKNNAHVVQSFYTSLTSTRAKNHREGKAFANWVVPLNTGAVRARDYVNHEGVTLADRPIIEWYLNDSAHERIFTKFDDPRAWYTNGGTHPGFVNPEWWISPSEGNWQRIV
jgi:hypothetical protein